MARTKPQNRPKPTRKATVMTIADAPMPDPAAGVPAEVLAYLDSVVSARSQDIMPNRPPAGIFHYILANWSHFDGNPHGLNATRMSLGREWREAATAWWMNEMRRDFEAGIPQAVLLVANLITMSTPEEAVEAGVPWEQVEEAKKLFAAKALVDMSQSSIPAKGSGCAPEAPKPKRGPSRSRKTVPEQPNLQKQEKKVTNVNGGPILSAEQPKRPKRKIDAPVDDIIELPKRQKSQAVASTTEVAPAKSPKQKADASAEDIQDEDEVQAADEADELSEDAKEKENQDPFTSRGRKKRRIVSDDSVVAAWSHLSSGSTGKTDAQAEVARSPPSADASPDGDSDEDIWEVPQRSPKKARTIKKPVPHLKLKKSTANTATVGDQEQDDEDAPVSQVAEARQSRNILRLKIGKAVARLLSNRNTATEQSQSNEEDEDDDSTQGSSSTKRYFGSWKHEITGPSKDDKAALTPPVSKNKSSNPADKVWECTHHPEPLPRKKAARAGLDLDDANVLSELLTLRFELKSDPETKLVYRYDPPSDWNDQKEITSLVKVITQHRRREAGAKGKTRHTYTKEETAWLANYFEEHKYLQGNKSMQPVTKWEGVAAAFNKKFQGREVKIASKGDEVEVVGGRSWHAIMALSERNADILKARKCEAKKKSPKAREAGALENEVMEAGASTLALTPAPKKTRLQLSKAK